MKKINYFALFLSAALMVTGCLQPEPQPKEESIESLLKEMGNRELLAQYPETNFRLKQQSSYNRASVTPEDSIGWFMNKDFDVNFIRTEINNDREEWVLMEHLNPGAIVRIWFPFRKDEKEENSIIRFYLDGSETPTIEGKVGDLFDGNGLIPYPLAHPSLKSSVSFFPIPYAKSCKITLEQQPFFFIFTYRDYNESTKVKTFTMEDFERARPEIEITKDKLLQYSKDEIEISSSQLPSIFNKKSLEPGEEMILELPKGETAINNLMVKLGNYNDPQVTRSVILKIEFDDKQTVWCPIGDFFGTGVGLHPFADFNRSVLSDGSLISRWQMPYQESGKVSILNLHNDSVEVDLEITTSDYEWDANSMYFHSAWRYQPEVPTRPFSDWNYVTLSGRGVYVGDVLTVMNPVEKWWGEGDAKIWVDNDTFPSMFGTGTEDYYAYSWGGKSINFYDHPFHSQVRCGNYDSKNIYDGPGKKDTKGYSTETRIRQLDGIPFEKSLKLDMEVWHWEDVIMAYAASTFWYGDKETTCNLIADEDGARLSVDIIP